MKQLSFFLFLTLLPFPAQAITWDQFWRPFRYERPYYVNEYEPICTRRVYHREYVPGDYWRSGYTKTWSETIRVPCYDY